MAADKDKGRVLTVEEAIGGDVDQELLEKTLERVEAMEDLAERILAETRITLMMSFRFLDRALWKMPYQSVRLCNRASDFRLTRQSMLLTDGHVLYYNAKAVIGSFRKNPDIVVRAYLHTLLHCIFRHPFRTVRSSMPFWALSCDICVETIAHEMCAGRFALEEDETIEYYKPIVNAFCNGLTPAKLYRMMLMSRKETATAEHVRLVAGLETSRDYFARDDHSLWDLLAPPKDEEQPESGGGGAGDNSGDGENDPSESPDNPDAGNPGDVPDGNGEESDLDPDEGEEPSESEGDQGDDRSREDDRQTSPNRDQNPQPQSSDQAEPEYSEAEPLQLQEPVDPSDEEDWEEIAKQVETALQTLEKERGDAAGTFMDNLALANRSRVDYEDFLRRFATRMEDARLNDEEFDYIFYTYGLKLYENMPLVEPLEYKETERVREFVVAIDTSSSCSHGLIQLFLTRTYEILSKGHGFGDQVNVHIIQCDAEVQSDDVIHNTSEMAAYEEGFTVRGYGGTDFRPVFAYVEDLLAQGEFDDLRGLVYFTDGYGTFPNQAPDYDVAFVFVEEEGKERRVPPWAMKVVLNGDTLYEMEMSE